MTDIRNASPHPAPAAPPDAHHAAPANPPQDAANPPRDAANPPQDAPNPPPDAPPDAARTLDGFRHTIEAFTAYLEDRFGTATELARQGLMQRAEHTAACEAMRHLERLLRLVVVLRADAIADTLKPIAPRAPAAPRAVAPPAHNGIPREPPASTPEPASRGIHAWDTPPADFRPPAFHLKYDSCHWRVSFSLNGAARRVRPAPSPDRPPSPRERFNAEWREKKLRMEQAGIRRPFIPRYEPWRFVDTSGLAKRLEAARRVLGDTDAYARRAARRILRRRSRLASSNEPAIVTASFLRSDAKSSWQATAAAMADMQDAARDVLRRRLASSPLAPPPQVASPVGEILFNSG